MDCQYVIGVSQCTPGANNLSPFHSNVPYLTEMKAGTAFYSLSRASKSHIRCLFIITNRRLILQSTFNTYKSIKKSSEIYI